MIIKKTRNIHSLDQKGLFGEGEMLVVAAFVEIPRDILSHLGIQKALNTVFLKIDRRSPLK